jgi:hypothetical protein
MEIYKNVADAARKVHNFRNIPLLIICIMLVICLDFFRVIGDIMESWNLPLPVTYGAVIFLSVFAPLLLIAYGFRTMPPLFAFSAVFVIAGPFTCIIYLLLFSTAPLDLLTTPAYVVGLVIVSILLATIASGVALYNDKKKWALLLIGAGSILYILQFREILVSYIGLMTLFVTF